MLVQYIHTQCAYLKLKNFSLVNLSADRAIAKAKTHAKDGDIATARALLNAVQKAAPSNKLAKLLSNCRQRHRSFRHQNHPKNSQTTIKLYNQGELVEAVNFADKVLVEFPKSYLVWNICGAANKALGQLTIAHDAFEKVTQLIRVILMDLIILERLKDQGNQDAISSCQKAISLKPDYAEAHNNLGTTQKDQGNLKDAISSYQKAISLKPDYALAHINRERTKDQGNLKDAISSYQKAISLKPDFAMTHAQLNHQKAHVCDWSKTKDDVLAKKSVGYRN